MYIHLYFQRTYEDLAGWLGWAMVLGSFQCRGVLLLAYSKARACCAFSSIFPF